MTILSRAQYVDLIERAYFGSVMREDFAAVLACFTDDARITIYHGDNPVRRFHRRPAPGQQPFTVFYGHLSDNYVVLFTNFRHIIDVENACCASTFYPSLSPKPGSAYAETGKLTLNNCNFFWFSDGLIADMIIYYANPTLGARLGVATTTPTAFPKV